MYHHSVQPATSDAELAVGGEEPQRVVSVRVEAGVRPRGAGSALLCRALYVVVHFPGWNV